MQAKDKQIEQALQKLKEQQFRTEQRIAEEQAVIKELKRERDRTALPWHRQAAALFGLYGKTAGCLGMVALISFGFGGAIGMTFGKDIVGVVKVMGIQK